MAIMATIEGAGSVEDYRQISDALDLEVCPPPGLILHAIVECDGKLRAIDIWESPQAATDFYEDRLRPTIDDVAPTMPQPPPPEFREVVGFVRP